MPQAHGRCDQPHHAGDRQVEIHCFCPDGAQCPIWPGGTGAARVAAYLANGSGSSAALVAESGSADQTVQTMIDAGWTLSDNVEYIDGKRIRYMVPPKGEAS